MNTTIELLFQLDIPLDYYNKLKNYYYIPENKIIHLKLGGSTYLVDKYIANKQLNYIGIITKITNSQMLIKNNYPIDFTTVLLKYHVFYKPKSNKMNKAVQMLNIINKQ